MHLPFVYHGDASKEALMRESLAKKDGFFYDSEGSSFGPGSTFGKSGARSWEKTVAQMSEVELDAELADVYAREFGLSKEALDDQERRKWSKRREDKAIDGVKPSHVKYDKKGNAIYPKKGPSEEFFIVDGYNIIFAWEELCDLAKRNVDAARDSLKDILCNFRGYRGCRLILVFDAYKVKGNPGKKELYNGIEVVYTRSDETADACIERMVHDVREKYRVTVATSDALE